MSLLIHKLSLLDVLPPPGSSPETLYAARDALDAKTAALEGFVAEASFRRQIHGRQRAQSSQTLGAPPRGPLDYLHLHPRRTYAIQAEASAALARAAEEPRGLGGAGGRAWSEANDCAESSVLRLGASISALARGLAAPLQSRILEACTAKLSALGTLHACATLPVLSDTLPRCKSLTKLVLTFSPLGLNESTLQSALQLDQTPFSALTSLEIWEVSVSYTIFRGILVNSAALLELTLSVQEQENEIHRLPVQVLRHARLLQLRLCLEDDHRGTQQVGGPQRSFFERLRFPSLRCLSLSVITDSSENAETWEDGICQGILSHSPDLESLSCDMTAYENRDLESCCPTQRFVDALQHLPSLTALSLVFEHRVALMQVD
uniref:F-box domain-containing protein n=1 Tax=Mycena chlorophos TaxID=658473 RepID=A0ABQ0LRI0_MYCCL|nr:predicted protein [Mycena chlorophos]